MITQVSDTVFTFDISNPLFTQLVFTIFLAFMTWSWLIANWITKKLDQLKAKKLK